MSKWKKYLLIAAAVIIFLGALTVGAILILNYRLSQSLAKNGQGNFTVLLLGEAGPGQGGEWEQAPYLTDSIILFQFVPKENVLDMVSVPRDLYGTFGTSTLKVNEAYENGDLQGLMNTLPNITGITTHNFVVVDLNFVQTIVDALGGIDVNLPDKVTDSVSGYTIPSGEQHLDGAEVIFIIRNRYEAQGDFFREDNQHLIVEALLQKYLSLNLIQQAQFIAAVSPQVKGLDTNVSFSEVYPLIAEGSKLTFNSVDFSFSSGLFESSTTTVGNGSEYILIPTAGINNCDKLREYITLQLQSATQTPPLTP